MSKKVHASDILQERVDETEKDRHEPWVKTYAGGKPNYTTPAEKREWVGLTDQEYVHEQQEAWSQVNVVDGFNTGEYSQVFWKRIEAKLKEKNT